MPSRINRRDFVAGSASLVALIGALHARRAQGGPRVSRSIIGPYGPLRPVADLETGLPLILLPEGFEYRTYSWSGDPMSNGEPTPEAHDGMGVIAPARRDGEAEVILVRNHERAIGSSIPAPARYDRSSPAGPGSAAAGGTTTLRFRGRRWLGAEPSLGGTIYNCAGGVTPWGTWLSCEETSSGRVWECDPLGVNPAVVRPAMGTFNHEAAACDPVGQHVYLTEDTGSGKLRRFRPNAWGDLSSGTLEAAVVSGSTVTWTTTISSGTGFNGGEGAWYADGKVWFTTKGDNRVWELDVRADPNTIRVIYDDNTSPNPVLSGVDNIVGSASGDLFVAEDGGNMELVLIEPGGAVSVFLRVLDQSGSEIAGPAFSPDGSRLYFSSQRGPSGSGQGVTYEVGGPFRTDGGPPPTTTTTSTTTPVSITLSGMVRTVRRRHYVDLVWSGATTSQVEIRRNDAVVATIANDGAHTDNLGRRTGTFRYRVSHPGGTPISDEVAVTV